MRVACSRSRAQESGISLSMGSTGDCFDNAMAESFFASLETELIDRSFWWTPADARLAVVDHIEAFYNPAVGIPPSATSARPTLRGGTVRRPRPPNR